MYLVIILLILKAIGSSKCFVNEQSYLEMGRVTNLLVLAAFLVVVMMLGEVYSYNHAWYMRCCRGCAALPHPAAKATCYAACMATAAGMAP